MTEESNKNKTLLMGLAAAGVLIGAALLFHWATSEEDDDEGVASTAGNPQKLQSELEAAKLVNVKKSQHGTLDDQYFLTLLQFVGTSARERTKGLRTKCTDDRRKYYKAEQWEQYEQTIKKALEAEDQAAQAVVMEVID